MANGCFDLVLKNIVKKQFQTSIVSTENFSVMIEKCHSVRNSVKWVRGEEKTAGNNFA